MSIAEIESALAHLSPREAAELLMWLQDYHAELWERQIKDDLEAGRLDELLAEVDREHERDTARPL